MSYPYIYLYSILTCVKCAPFDFSLDIEFVDDEQDIFSCNLPLIPLSLDSSQYTENPGFIHFKDTFVLDDRTMRFSVTQQSFLRVSISGSGADIFNCNNIRIFMLHFI